MKIKTKEELLQLGFVDQGEYGVSKRVGDEFRFSYHIYVNGDDVYFVIYKTSTCVEEVKDGLSSLEFGAKHRDSPKALENAKAILKEIGYEVEE
ncbi:MAG: hypothetical protein LBV67_07085 [Streptococcaceae bacterium]|jgi:hypothetical protein|nr:hypothetical protein [Streptococcaceae bacterium]